jgi:low temperature requirement protein LtrA
MSTGQVFAALFGIAVVAALWWAYFDVVAIVAERRLSEALPGEQAPLARDAYSYLHFPLIAGIVLLALGLKETLAGTGEPLDTVPALALCGGPALYLLGQVAFRERILGSFSPHRALAAAALLALIPLALGADALIALAAVSIVLAILIAYEAVHYRDQRARVRANPGATLAEMRGT